MAALVNSTWSSPSDLEWCLQQCAEHPLRDRHILPHYVRFTKYKPKVWCRSCYLHARGEDTLTEEQLRDLWDGDGNYMPARADVLLSHLKICERQSPAVQQEAARRLGACNKKRRRRTRKTGTVTISGASGSSSTVIYDGQGLPNINAQDEHVRTMMHSGAHEIQSSSLPMADESYGRMSRDRQTVIAPTDLWPPHSPHHTLLNASEGTPVILPYTSTPAAPSAIPMFSSIPPSSQGQLPQGIVATSEFGIAAAGLFVDNAFSRDEALGDPVQQLYDLEASWAYQYSASEPASFSWGT